MNLTASNVHDTFMKSLFSEGEDTTNYILGEGVMVKVGFHPGRLKEATPKINEMLNDLPDQFKEGWTFLNMVQDKEGNQWADLHQTVDELVCLGMAIGRLEYAMPREMWKVLPGGMPYIILKPEQKEETATA